MNKALAGLGIFAVSAGVLISGCTSSPQGPSTPPAVSSSASAAAAASADCMFSVFGADVEVGIAHPTTSCANWMRSLVGNGIAWYPIKHMLTVGSPDVADIDHMAETCDLTDGRQELYVEDGGEMPYGDGTCTREEQKGWKPETTPGPLAAQFG